MKRVLFLIMISAALMSCSKEATKPDTAAALKGKWKANLTVDVVFDEATGVELTRTNYLHGLETEITFDGAGSVLSVDNEVQNAQNTLTHSYNVHTKDNRTYLNTQFAGLMITDYEILLLNTTDLQLKGVIITKSPYSINDKNYVVYYERTQYFVKQ